MTTERRPVPPKARARVTALELRLYVVALLAVVYTISWRAIAGRVPATEPVVVDTQPTSEPPRFVWIDSVPPSLRPSIALPAGWQLASQQRVSATQNAEPARIVRVPTRRVHRVRTRSS